MLYAFQFFCWDKLRVSKKFDPKLSPVLAANTICLVKCWTKFETMIKVVSTCDEHEPKENISKKRYPTRVDLILIDPHYNS